MGRGFCGLTLLSKKETPKLSYQHAKMGAEKKEERRV